MIGTHFIDLSTISNDGKTGEFHQISQDSESESGNFQIYGVREILVLVLVLFIVGVKF